MAKLGRRISQAELNDIHRRQFEAEKEIRDKVAPKTLYDAQGKRIKAREIKGASKAIMLQTLISKLYKDGFIKKEGDIFKIDAGSRIEEAYGAGSTALDIRSALMQLINGFHVSGTTVSVNGVVLEGKLEGAIVNETNDDLRRKLRDLFGIGSEIKRDNS